MTTNFQRVAIVSSIWFSDRGIQRKKMIWQEENLVREKAVVRKELKLKHA